MSPQNYGQDGGQILPNFRTVVKSYVDQFRFQRDHVHHLLGGKHNYASGAFREGLLRGFLASVLPKSVSVESGFIYGFDQVANSKQIDILIWDSAKYSAVFRTGEFVIVSPESVIAAISVKTTLDRRDLVDSLENLMSVVSLDRYFRRGVFLETNEAIHRSILKLVVSYEGPSNHESALTTISEFFEERIANDSELAKDLQGVLQVFDPVHPVSDHVVAVDRVFPSLVAAIESKEISFYRGWGPPDDRTGSKTYGEGLRRLPYMYSQKSELTTALEKVVYHILRATYAALGTHGWSLVSAWGDINPALGFRMGDVDEIQEEGAVRLLDPHRLGNGTSAA